MDLALDGKNALVTGGSRGIGQGIAVGLAREGANVAVCARTEEPLAKTKEAIDDFGVKCHAMCVDLTDPQEIENFVRESSSVLNGLDILICNAGASFGGLFEDSTDEEWAQTIDLNLSHCVRAVRCALPVMKKQGNGVVLLVASISGWKPVRIRSAYAVAKAAQIQLAASLAQELAPHGIRVNAISPGSTIFESGGWDKYMREKPEEFSKFQKEEFPYQRLGQVDEIADVAVFLVSERARWINGANIVVDGGQRKPSAF